MKNRRIILEGAYNVRDLGGYRTDGGRTVRWGRLLRCDATHALSPGDVETLLRYGLTSVIDLRTREDADASPSVFAAVRHVKYFRLPMFSREHVDTWEGGNMADWYVFCLERAKTGIKSGLEALRRETANGCALVQCSMGRDRTGTIAAFVLRLLGVPIDVIADEHALTCC